VCKKTSAWTIICNVVFNEETGCSSMQKAIKIDEHLHVPLQFCGYLDPYPTFNLSSCFVHVRYAKLTQYGM